MKDPDAVDRTRSLWSDTETGPAPAYLLVVDGQSSSRFTLPADGTVLVGRGGDADLRLGDVSVSRKHARFTIAGSEVRVTDLESHNGVRVNGERLEGTRAVAHGDVISVGDVPLLLRGGRAPVPGPLLDLAQLRPRLEQEVARAIGYERPLAVVVVAVGKGRSADAVARAAAPHLRLLDVAGWIGFSQLLWLLPEVDADDAADRATRLLEALGPVAPDPRAGIAACPDDGCDAATLLDAARAAAAAASAGELAGARRATVVHRIGEREVLVADPAMIQTYQLLRRLAASELPVLLLGETGSGKENAARAVHEWSARAGKPFVTLNCAALQETLVESELFGFEKGAFSGAVKSKPGLLESAAGGTVFLDEIGELSAAAQAKLLRALEAKRVTRLGDLAERPIDIRVVAATHRDLDAEAKAGRFRQDLLFRLNTATVVLPPLRERPREIALLARAFLDAACAAARRPPMEIAPAATRLLARWSWPGNVRELKNLMEYAAAAITEERLDSWHLPARIQGAATDENEGSAAVEASASATPASPRRFRPLAEEQRELERRRMTEALEAADGNQTRAAELIAMPLRTFVKRMKEHGIGGRAARARGE